MSDSVPSKIRSAELSAANRHPSIETWIDYHSGAGGVSAEDSGRLQRHLSRCRRCLDLVLDLDGFAKPAEPQSGTVADFEKAAVWRAVKGAIEPARIAEMRRWPAIAAVAASLVFATVGFSAWNQQLGARIAAESQIADLTRLQANVMIEDLRPGARERSSAGVDATVELPAGAGTKVLILNLEDEVDFPDYEVRVFDAGDAEVTRVSGLVISEFGHFTVALPPGSLAAGSYELRLFGLSQQQDQLLEIYPIRLGNSP